MFNYKEKKEDEKKKKIKGIIETKIKKKKDRYDDILVPEPRQIQGVVSKFKYSYCTGS